jgi:uncharacterized protein DUF4214
MPALVEWNRVLRAGGMVRIRVPDLQSLAAMVLSGENTASVMAMLFGTQSYAGDFHMSGFTAESLTGMLQTAGFSAPSIQILDGWLLSAQASKVHSVESDAFKLAKDGNLSDTEFVKSIYLVLMGREADTPGIEHWVQSLRERARDRYQVISTIASSDEAQQKGAALVRGASS